MSKMELLSFAKNIGLLLCSIWLFGACKSSETTPDLAASMIGAYNVEYLNLAGTEITPEFMMMIGGTVAILGEKKTNTTLSLYIKTVVRGNTNEARLELSLTDAGNGVINLIEAGKTVGTYSNNRIDLTTTYNNGELKLKAKKNQ